MEYIVALSGMGDIQLYKTEIEYLDELLEKLECEGKVFMVIDKDKYIKDDMLCLNVFEIYKGEEE